MQFIKNTAKSYLFFIISIFISSLVYTSIIYFTNTAISNETLNTISLFVTIFIFFILGIYISRLFKEKGLMNSFIISLILILIILLFKLITKTYNSSYLIKALCNLFSACIGGIIGVNLKRK